MADSIPAILLAAAVFVCLFIIGRAFVLWYFKIDRIVHLLEEHLYALRPELRPKQDDHV